MGQVVKLNLLTVNKKEDTVYNNKVYKEKLIRIRDDIENYLCEVSVNEDDELAVALAAGRYASMKLTKLTGEADTKSFVNDCIKTTLNN